MMRIMTVAIATFLVMAFAISAEALPTKRCDPATQTCRIFTLEGSMRGFKVFRKNCKTCHYRNNDKNAPFLYSESKTSLGWNRVFSKKYPACAKDGSWGKLSHDDQEFLNDYLFENAFGTYDATFDCG